MSDRRTGMPLGTGSSREKQSPGTQGFRGERTEDLRVERPEFRHVIHSESGPIEVEERSGTAFVEATGAVRPSEDHRAQLPSRRARAALVATAAVTGAGAALWAIARAIKRTGASRHAEPAPQAAFAERMGHPEAFNLPERGSAVQLRRKRRQLG